jgi:hypothetical protein
VAKVELADSAEWAAVPVADSAEWVRVLQLPTVRLHVRLLLDN